MSGALVRMAQSVYNTPHLITQSSLESIAAYLEGRNEGITLKVDANSKAQQPAEIQFSTATGIGVISIEGPLTYAPQPFAAMCGLSDSSYQNMVRQFDTLLKVGAKTIILDVDSPGGQAYGCFETGRYLRAEADKHGINLVAYVDGLAASAGYALAASAHEIVMNPSAEAGSIGVVVRLRNTNEAMRKAGISDTYIYAGNNKIPFDASGGFKKEFIADVQERVDTLYEEFVAYTSQIRGLPKKLVIDTQAKTYSAKDALGIGLADRVMTRQEFSEYLDHSDFDPKASVSRTPVAVMKAPERVDGVTQYLKEKYRVK